MKNKKKVVTLIIIFLIIIAIMPTVYADLDTSKFKPTPLSGVTVITDIGNKILGVVQAVGIVASVAILMALGIKYMVGSVEEKASYKKSMMPYLIGAIMIFASATLVKLLYNIGMGINNS